ncbi:hypothetical protein CFB47_36615 [Burkholderia sp. AU27893]|uniref:Uncharacterized protein n=1 Tax=Burkholderia contaminans TaxID=488447 RepID=A0A2S5DPY0_9BURK|nr:hypothetical protein CFB47_36615 [Burkholderia sp. AU27893]POZ81102.1 hypothetical protein C3743_36340 [Burkholderia contaminans]
MLPASDDCAANRASAMAVVEALGAHTEAVADGNAITVRNDSCPVGSAVRRKRAGARLFIVD